MCLCSDDDWERKRRMRWRGGMVESQTAKRRKEKEWRSERKRRERRRDKGGGVRGGRKLHVHVCV